MKFNNYNEAFASFSLSITTSLQKLLQEKHLYQNVVIEINDFAKAVATMGPARISIINKMNSFWTPASRDAIAVSDLIGFITPDVKLFCKTCGRVEAFNHIQTIEVGKSEFKGIIQIYSLSFLCQSCKVVPEVFLVRRDAFKLTLCGRAPIENVSVPKDIPHSVKIYYSGAIVAHQSGQTLAGIFLLRCLIEQWAYIATPKKELQADETIDLYMKTLPDDFKARFPSLKEYYGKLSADIHSAKGSVDLFNETSEKIKEHFEARRLYKLIIPTEDNLTA